jgi:hypothetical protein
MLREQKTTNIGCPNECMLEAENNEGVRSIATLENEEEKSGVELLEMIRSATLKIIEPPYTERFVGWCERSATQIMGSLLLDGALFTLRGCNSTQKAQPHNVRK